MAEMEEEDFLVRENVNVLIPEYRFGLLSSTFTDMAAWQTFGSNIRFDGS